MSSTGYPEVDETVFGIHMLPWIPVHSHWWAPKVNNKLSQNKISLPK